MINLFKVNGKIMIVKEDETAKMEKRVFLVQGTSFTEIEAVATEYINEISPGFEETMSIEKIEKAKYSDITKNKSIDWEESVINLIEYFPVEDEDAFWELDVAFIDEQENGKDKVTKEKFLMPASSQKEAIVRLEEKLKTTEQPWSVVGGKITDIYAVLVTDDFHKVKTLEEETIARINELPEGEK